MKNRCGSVWNRRQVFRRSDHDGHDARLTHVGTRPVAGLREKYGMEYRRAYFDESDDHGLTRHEHEIFPLMHRRHLFSQAEDFALYDVIALTVLCSPMCTHFLTVQGTSERLSSITAISLRMVGYVLLHP